MMEKASFSKRIAMALKKNGVTEIFGQSNPPTVTLECMKLGIRQIGYRQENAGSYMAQGYAMCSGKVSVITAQNGPAATLIVPGLAECLKAGHPVVAIVQEVNQGTRDKNAFQELDHRALFGGVAKWIKTISTPARVEDYVDMAFVAASSGRPGPAVLLCPTEFLFDPTEYPMEKRRTAALGRYPLDRYLPGAAELKAAAQAIAAAKNPIIYAGGGVISSQAQAVLRQIQEEFSIPVATTTMGKGAVDEEHPLTIGTIGYYMGRKAYTKFLKPMVQEADLILLAGNRTNQNGTDSWTLLPEQAKYIQIDIDHEEISRNYESMRLFGDAKLTLEGLAEALHGEDTGHLKAGRKEKEAVIADARAKHQEEIKASVESRAIPLRTEGFLAEVEKQLEDDHIIVADASLSSPWLANCIRAKGERKFIFPRGIAGLGWGLPLAMGAAIAQPERKVFCLAGDGGFAHVWSELETCKREGINVVLVVLNNSILGYQKIAEVALVGEYTNVCDLGPVDHTLVAEACGVKGIKVTRPEEIGPALSEAFATKGTVVLDVYVEPSCVPGIGFMMAGDTL